MALRMDTCSCEHTAGCGDSIGLGDTQGVAQGSPGHSRSAVGPIGALGRLCAASTTPALRMQGPRDMVVTGPSSVGDSTC